MSCHILPDGVHEAIGDVVITLGIVKGMPPAGKGLHARRAAVMDVRLSCICNNNVGNYEHTEGTLKHFLAILFYFPFSFLGFMTKKVLRIL